MRFVQFRDQSVDLLIQIAAVLAGARDDQRRARFVDQDRVHLVDNREIVATLGHFGDRGFHIVAQIVKAQFVVGGIGDVGAVGGDFFGFGLVGVNHPRRQAQSAVNLAHPRGVTLGEIVVHGDNVNTFPGKSIQIGRKGGDQGLAFARAHFGNIALMQENPALQLHIKGPQAQCAARRFAAIGKGFGQERVKAFAALLHALFEGGCLGDDPLIA